MGKRKNETYAEFYERYVKKCKWYRLNHARQCKEWRERNKDIRDIQLYEEREKRKEKMRTDPEYAEHRRASRRESRQKLLRKKGLVKSEYKPRYNVRIPEWACSGQDLILRGTFLENCYTPTDLKSHKMFQIENGRRR